MTSQLRVIVVPRATFLALLCSCGQSVSPPRHEVPPNASCRREIDRKQFHPRQLASEDGLIALELETSAVDGPAPAYIRLRLRNNARETLWVNSRMVTGPDGYANKEIWLDAVNIATGEHRAQKYCAGMPAPRTPEDYILLAPDGEYSVVRPLSCF